MRRALVWLFRRLVGLYFQSIEEVGERPAANTRSRLFVSNHVNALIDPMLVITRAPCEISPIAKSTLWSIPGLRWLLDAAKAVPIVRRRDDPTKGTEANDAIFERIAAFLGQGGNILIFPEGTSHNEPQLQKLKSGAARMLARAEADGARDATFQAIGLEFEARDVFRSRALILYGPVRSVRDFADEPTSEARIAAMTSRMRDDLSELLVEDATWAQRLLVARVAELLRNETGDASFAGWSSIGRQVEAAKRTLSVTFPERIASIDEAVTAYFDLLEKAGIEDEMLATTAPQQSPTVTFASVLRTLLVPLALVGVVVYFLPYQLPRQVARRAREVDMHSTLKLGTGLLVYPIWTAILAATLFALVPRQWLLPALAVVLTAPFAALDWLEHRSKLSRSLLLATRARRLTELSRARAKALDRIRETEAVLLESAPAESASVILSHPS
jgi:1-acyl-sn-glycerol-3-phosphate acyltransferase